MNIKGHLLSVSIAIPTYNEEKNIKKCLSAIFNQTYPKELVTVITGLYNEKIQV